MIVHWKCAKAPAIGCLFVLSIVAGAVVISTVVPAPPPVSAATVSLGTIQAQMANHLGVNNGASSGNCIRYAPPGSASTSTVVSNPSEALTAHGYRNNCPNSLSTQNQSAVGFAPSSRSTVEDGEQFLIGRMVHFNNPITADDRYFTGELRSILTGFAAPNTLTFNWSLDETPNSGGGNCCNDELTFTNQISDTTLVQGGLRFRLVMLGFVPLTSGTTCPATATGTPRNVFSTVEGATTYACLYAAVQQLRTLTIVKNVVGSPPTPRTFEFRSTSTLAGSPWTNSTFALGAAGTVTRDLTSGNSVTVTETDPLDDRWTLTGLTCTQASAAGPPQPVPGATINVAARQVVLANIPPPPNLTQPGITCTYTNTYTPKSTLTLVKQVTSGTAAPSLWTLRAIGATPPAAGTTISGPSGSPAVTTQRVVAGAYDLSEVGTGAAETGYVQDGAWVCRTTAGTIVPVAAGRVTLADSAAAATAANVTCTIANRLATGSLRILKVVDAPAGAYTGGTTKTFAGTYDCGTGFAGAFSTLTTAAPVVISGIPAGRACTATEQLPSGGLLNASYAWELPSSSAQPVIIADQTTSDVTITNTVTQRFGTFAITKTVDGPGGYTGGTTRVFPVQYTCTLANGPTTSGTIDLTLAEAASPATAIAAGSSCSFAETLEPQDGDFADQSYVWGTPVITPPAVTIGDGVTGDLGITNPYVRQFGSLVIAKQVVGDGYLGGSGQNFGIGYDCGPDFTGSRVLADGESTTVGGLPAGAACAVQEFPPAPDLLAPAFTWGTPTWAPGPVGVVPANGSTTLTVSNPTVPIFGQVRVTKEIAGDTDGVIAGATFQVDVTCPNGLSFALTIGVGATGTTGDIPVGSTCTVSEVPPSDGLVDGSYAWAPTPPAQVVTITASGQVIPVTMTNTVVRVFGTVAITKGTITPAGIVDASRPFTMEYSCVYGNDAPVTGTLTIVQGQTAATALVLVGSQCQIAEQPGSLATPPSATDPSWVWLPVTYDPSDVINVTGPTAQPALVTNSIVQRTASFSVTKAVVGADGYTPGTTFDFSVTCGGTTRTFAIADGETFDGGTLPAFTTCTLVETAAPPVPPAFGWDPPTFTVNGAVAGGGTSVTFTIPDTGAPVQVNVTNPITPRLGSVTIAKAVTGETAGLDPAAPPFTVTLVCGPGLTFQLSVPANSSATQDGIPVGSTCVATESAPTGGLVDASYAWGEPAYTPPDATVTVTAGTPPTVTVTNDIVRVTAPVLLLKTFAGFQGVVDPEFEYPISWQCTYDGAVVASGSESVVAGPSAIEVASDVPATSVCTPAEAPLGTPSVDPAFRWDTPVLTGTTVTAPGPNTMTVTNRLVRDNGSVLVQKVVTGATEGYIGGTGEVFTLHGQCRVPGQPQIPVRTRDGTIANGGSVLIEPVSVNWTCFGDEDTPSQDLLRDTSYGWAPPILDPPGDFTLTAAGQQIVFRAENPIVRVRSAFSIAKQVVDPFGAVVAGTTFTGTYSCQYGSDAPVTGTWSITPDTNDTFAVPDVLLESVCTVTEDAPAATSLVDGSYAWAAPVVGAPATVVAGGTASVTVTNTVTRQWSGLQITKRVVDPDGGLVPGATFGGVWVCVQGRDSFSDRFIVSVADVIVGGAVTVFTPEAQRVPATAICTVTEDTQDANGLRDASFAWGEPTYTPVNVALVAGEIASLGVTNTVVRVYSDVTIRKVVTGPADGLVTADRPFTGTVTCQYGTDAPIESTWSATLATPFLRAGVLVGSVCTATEDPPGATGQPVDGDSSYIWTEPVIGGPIIVTPPDVATPPIVVTNPTDRLFGTFSVDKAVTGAVEGIADLAAPFPMDFSCTPGTGTPISGQLDVTIGSARTVGPELQIPTGSVCTLTEPAATMPPLVDEAWAWGDPVFVVDGVATPSTDRTLTFTIPTPQEDQPEPNVAIAVVNPVQKVAGGAFTIAKTSDPPTGTLVAPGTVITYTLTATSTGTVPVHDVVLTDDLSGVLVNATVVDGSVSAPAGTSATLSIAEQRLVWTVGTMAPDETTAMTYQVRVDADAIGASIRNSVTAVGDVPPTDCPATAPVDDRCAVSHETSPAPTIAKTVSSPPALNPDGTLTLAYDIVVTNTGGLPTTYTLTDTFAFAPGVRVIAAAATNVEPGTVATNTAFDGASANTIATTEIAAGATHRYRVTVTANVGAVTGTTALDCTLDAGETGTGLLNRATINPTAEACAPIPNAADLRVRKEVDAATVTIDRSSTTRTRIVYTVTVTNAGPLAAVDTVATDTLPGGVVPVSAAPAVGTCTRDGATLTCRLGTIAPGTTVRILVTIELPATYASETVRNSVSVASATLDPDLSNNSGAVATRVRTGETLPYTGAQIMGSAILGLGLVGGGLAFVLATRRRRLARAT